MNLLCFIIKNNQISKKELILNLLAWLSKIFFSKLNYLSIFFRSLKSLSLIVLISSILFTFLFIENFNYYISWDFLWLNDCLFLELISCIIFFYMNFSLFLSLNWYLFISAVNNLLSSFFFINSVKCLS